jgi:hypothetical protein
MESARVGGAFGLLERAAELSRGDYLGTTYSYQNGSGTTHGFDEGIANTEILK